MIYLLFGEDTFRSRQKLAEIITRFSNVAGGAEAISHIRAEEMQLSEIRDIVENQSLFRQKQLILWERISEADVDIKQYVKEKLKLFSSDADIIVFWDVRLATEDIELFELIKKHAKQSQEFKPRAPKISLGRNSGQAAQQNVFALTDAIGTRKKQAALLQYAKLLGEGLLPERIFWALAWHIKNLAMVLELKQQGKDAAEISKETKLHPFVVKKSLSQAAGFSHDVLKNMYKELVFLDKDTKTGRADLALGLERIILSL